MWHWHFSLSTGKCFIFFFLHCQITYNISIFISTEYDVWNFSERLWDTDGVEGHSKAETRGHRHHQPSVSQRPRLTLKLCRRTPPSSTTEQLWQAVTWAFSSCLCPTVSQRDRSNYNNLCFTFLFIFILILFKTHAIQIILKLNSGLSHLIDLF